MAKIEIMPKKRMDADIAVSGVRYVVPPKMTFEVRVEFDNKIFKQVKDDSLLIGEMDDKVLAVYRQTCAGIKSKVSAFESLVSGMVDKGASPGEVEKQLDGLNKSIEKDTEIAEFAAEEEVKKVWKTYSAKKKEYLAYKISVAATVAGAFAGLTASIAAMATTPFTAGYGTSMSIIGMAKSVIVIARELHSAWITVEKAAALLSAEVNDLEKIVQSVGKKKNEYTAMVVEQFLGVAMPSIKSCMTHLETVEAKLVGVEVKTHDAVKALNRLLDLQEKFDVEFMKDVKERLDQHPSPKAKPQIREIEADLDKEMALSRVEVVKQIEAIDALYDRFKSVEEAVEELQQRRQAAGGAAFARREDRLQPARLRRPAERRLGQQRHRQGLGQGELRPGHRRRTLGDAAGLRQGQEQGPEGHLPRVRVARF